MLAMKLSDKLKRLCGQRGWGQSNLRGFVPHITKSSISNWFSGKYKPDLDSALRMARGLEVPLDWLADDDADFPPPVEERMPEDEAALLRLYRALELDEAEALRRLATPVPERQGELPPHKSGPGYIGPTRFETEADDRREAGKRKKGPNRSTRPAKAASEKPTGRGKR